MDTALKKIELDGKIIALIELQIHIQKQINELEEQKHALYNQRTKSTATQEERT